MLPQCTQQLPDVVAQRAQVHAAAQRDMLVRNALHGLAALRLHVLGGLEADLRTPSEGGRRSERRWKDR